MKSSPLSEFKESASHRDGLIPMTYHCVDHEKNTNGFPMHWHEELKSGISVPAAVFTALTAKTTMSPKAISLSLHPKHCIPAAHSTPGACPPTVLFSIQAFYAHRFRTVRRSIISIRSLTAKLFLNLSFRRRIPDIANSKTVFFN